MRLPKRLCIDFIYVDQSKGTKGTRAFYYKEYPTEQKLFNKVTNYLRNEQYEIIITKVYIQKYRKAKWIDEK